MTAGINTVISDEVLWYASRATGVVAVVLLTVVMILGMMITGVRRPASQTPTVIMALHRWLSVAMVLFLGMHVGTAIAEAYVVIDLIAIVVPMASEYESLWVGLGAVAVDLLIVVMITSWLRGHLPERVWKPLHFLSYLMWAASLVHGYQLGTSDQPFLRGLTVVCAVVGLSMVGWRVLTSTSHHHRRRVIDSQEWQ